ncbi:RNA ligase (ATP) [Shigella flexneri]
MSTFMVKVLPIKKLEKHPNADTLALAYVNDYVSIVGLTTFSEGDLVAYIPEGAVVPDAVAAVMGLDGKIGNRLKAIKLRGIVSQGILYPIKNKVLTLPNGTEVSVEEGDDVMELLGITKYVPEIPANLSGEVFASDPRYTVKFDIENIKNYPDIILEGEEVVFTEKLHGTFTQIVYLPPRFIEAEGLEYKETFGDKNGLLMVGSKSLSADGLMFKANKQNDNNVYVKVIVEQDMLSKFTEQFKEEELPVIMLGETFGSDVQDLRYGFTHRGQNGFRAFAIYKGLRSRFKVLNSDELDMVLSNMMIERVPVLYRGPFSKEVMNEHTNGLETVSGKEMHIREGIVITPVIERYDNQIGRVILKNVSSDYLLRKGKATEFQ